jgi:hypothetical protein
VAAHFCGLDEILEQDLADEDRDESDEDNGEPGNSEHHGEAA